MPLHGPEYETAKRIAFTGPEAVRAALGASAATRPELLYFLAGDQAASVRAAVAGNGATPPQADRLLAGDEDPAVRAVLGRKLAALAPELSREEQDRLSRLSWQTLCALVADAAVRVRAAIADAVAEMPDAPHALILRLAKDAEMPVAEPLIRLSPLLTEEDLLALVAAPAVPATVTAVARRPGISEAISDAIVARADHGSITALLENASAAIREATLDGLIAGAAEQAVWQAPLVQRPALSPQAIRALAEIVADRLLQVLANRPDLDPAVTAELRSRVAQRMASGQHRPDATETAFQEAAAEGDRARMIAILAEAAHQGIGAIHCAIELRSAKGLVALCWRAGFAPTTAVTAQVTLGQVATHALLHPPPEGGWPLAADEMGWQLDLLVNAG